MTDAIKEDLVLDAIESTGGRFFSATFTKKSGEKRDINARTHPDDNPSHWNPEERGMKLVWDMQKGGFRTITLSEVSRFTFADKTVVFD